jgi:DNA polymerase III delta prime subunit
MTTFDDLLSLWKSGNFPQTSLFVSEDTESALAIIKKFASQIFASETKIPLENNTDFQVISKISNEDEVKKEITIDQIRRATDFLSKTAGISNTKILVIYQADLLNLNAANASLKMLEEPGKRSYIFLVTHYQNAILETIKSRCAIFSLTSTSSTREVDYNFFMPKNTDELFKFASDLALKKNLEIWNEYTITALDLMSQMIKISSGIIADDLPRQFDFRDYNTHYLIHQYNRIKQIIVDTNEYEMDKKQSSIMIYEIVNCS